MHAIDPTHGRRHCAAFRLETYVRHAFETLAGRCIASTLQSTGEQALTPKKELKTYALVNGGLVVGDQIVLQGGYFLKANYWFKLL